MYRPFFSLYIGLIFFLKKIPCNKEVHAIHIKTIYPPDLNLTAGLLYVSTANNAESNAFSRQDFTCNGNPFIFSQFNYSEYSTLLFTKLLSTYNTSSLAQRYCHPNLFIQRYLHDIENANA